jgi:Family of unknown function (DUF6112)
MPQLLLSHLLLYVQCLAIRALGDTKLGQAVGDSRLGRVLAQDIVVKPEPLLPGSNLPQILINGLAFLSIGLAGVAFLVGAACWGFGSVTSNYGRADFGKRCTFYATCGAVITGAAAALLNFAVDLGQAADPGKVGG